MASGCGAFALLSQIISHHFRRDKRLHQTDPYLLIYRENER
jgi:hypothetical protein